MLNRYPDVDHLHRALNGDALELTQHIMLRWKNENQGSSVFLGEKFTKTILKTDKFKVGS